MTDVLPQKPVPEANGHDPVDQNTIQLGVPYPKAPNFGKLWVSMSIILVVSAMIARASIEIYGVPRAVALAGEYFVWAISAGIVVWVIQIGAPAYRLASPVRKSLIAFLSALILSTLLVSIFEDRPAMNAVIAQTAALIYMTIPFFVFQTASKAANVGKIVILTCHAVVIVCLFSILADFTGVASFESTYGRYFGFMGDQAAWALTLPLLVYFCSKRFVLAVAPAVGLALTASRGPALCVAAALIPLVMFSHGRRFQYVLTFSAMAFIALFQSSIFTTLFGRLRSTELTSSDRLVTARLGLRIFSDSPIFGEGYNSFAYYFPYRTHRTGELPTQTSTFVQMLSDGGLLVLLPYAAFVIVTTLAGISLMKRSRMIPDSDVINGMAAWLLAMLWVNQSAAWFVVGSYIGPLVLSMAGIVAGYQAKFGNVLTWRDAQIKSAPTMQLS